MKLPALAVLFGWGLALVNGVHASVDGQIGSDLVKLEGDQMVALGPKALEKKKLVAIYYSAHWCPPCRAFTPELSAFYDEISRTHPEFELVFVSSDENADAMKKYMEWGKMKFPAVSFDKIASNPWLKENSAAGIPYLVVFDGDGKMVLGKAPGQDWRPPQEVLAELKKLLGKSA
ncbi:MAG: hypothetical protein OHK005_10710 [Candidatus Methylacidiphilales bacterium]